MGMKTSFFSFDGEDKSVSKKKTIEFSYQKYGDCRYNQYAFLAKGVSKDNDPSHFWMPYIYPIEIEGEQYLASTDGRVLHYVPLTDKRIAKTVYEVDKLNKNDVSLKEVDAPSHFIEASKAMLKVLPSKDTFYEIPPYSTYAEKNVNREFLFLLINKLSGGQTYFKLDYLSNFIDHFDYINGEVIIYAPRAGAGKPWRFEHRDKYGKNLFYGIVLATAQMFPQVLSAKNMYAGFSEEKEEKKETVEDINEQTNAEEIEPVEVEPETETKDDQIEIPF